MFHLYGFILGIGLLAGFWVSSLQARRWGIVSSFVENSLLWIAIPAVIGARAYHLITDWHLYTHASILQLVAVWNGGLGFFGALVGGMVGLMLYVAFQKKKRTTNDSQLTTFFTILDLLAFGAPFAQAIGRFGNFFNQELYGLPTELPWGISVGGVRYHPLFAYEVIANLCVCAILNWLGWRKKLGLGKGQYACVYIILYGVIRFWLEFLRIDTARSSLALLNIFSTAQWVSIVLTFVAFTVFWLRRHADRGIEWELQTLL